MKLTVITAITNGNDELRDDFPEYDADFVAFLDEDSKIEAITNDLWEVRDCYDKFKESRRNAKIHKIVPHWFVDTDISIWLDGNISLNVSPQELVKLWLKEKDIAVCKHFERTCIYTEGDVVKHFRLDDPKLVDEQLGRYRQEGYPEENGMAECGVIIRRHTPEINRLSEKWWQEICMGSSRDQISFPVIARRLGIRIRTIKGSVRSGELNKYFDRIPHEY